MTYEETLAFLYDRLPMFSRVGTSAIKPGLDNIERLCRILGDPQTTFPSLHVAGTNGKGSVSHMLASVLQSCGYQTGLYTSPHLHDFRERIRIDGEMVPTETVIDFTQRISPSIEAMSPSFFEITVAMALEHFASHPVDIAVIETGLGGRLDSTNILRPLVSVITNIGWDHMNLLGNTLPAIAAEKAGIIKTNIPVVIGEPDPASLFVFQQKASEMGSPLVLAPTLRRVTAIEQGLCSLHISTETTLGVQESWELDLRGRYQTQNLLTVLATLDTLRQQGWSLPYESIQQGLRHAARRTGLLGRWQQIRRKPRIVLDVAHNQPGMRELLKQLSETPHDGLHLVMGMVRDKDLGSVLQLMPAAASYYFTEAGIQRALPATELLARADALGLRGQAYSNVQEALSAALRSAGASDLIVVCGSIFLVGEVDASAFSDAD